MTPHEAASALAEIQIEEAQLKARLKKIEAMREDCEKVLEPLASETGAPILIGDVEVTATQRMTFNKRAATMDYPISQFPHAYTVSRSSLGNAIGAQAARMYMEPTGRLSVRASARPSLDDAS